MATVLHLDYEPEYEFDIMAISSNQKAHTLCWEINNILESELCLIEPLEFKVKNQVCMFKRYKSEQDEFVFDVVSNKNGRFRFVKEYKTLDYFIKFYEQESPYSCQELTSLLRKSKLVQAVFRLEIDKLKSKQVFLF